MEKNQIRHHMARYAFCSSYMHRHTMLKQDRTRTTHQPLYATADADPMQRQFHLSTKSRKRLMRPIEHVHLSAHLAHHTLNTHTNCVVQKHLTPMCRRMAVAAAAIRCVVAVDFEQQCANKYTVTSWLKHRGWQQQNCSALTKSSSGNSRTTINPNQICVYTC